jgi:xanthine dehydrogenase accessory factor
VALYGAPPNGPERGHPAPALVKGGGEVGTAVALALWRAGWPVVVSELPRPTVLRRHLSLAEAAFAGSIVRDGVRAIRITAPAEVGALLGQARTIPLYVGSPAALLQEVSPALVVDARMRHGHEAAQQRHEAPLVVGLGPEFVAGRYVDVIVETCPGPELGQVVRAGSAQPYVPLVRGSDPARAEQYVRAPFAGAWLTDVEIGDVVTAGQALGWLNGTALTAPTTGSVRGLVHNGVTAPAGLKLAAVHPGDWQRKEAGIGTRAATIAATVVRLAAAEAFLPLGVAPSGSAAAVAV